MSVCVCAAQEREIVLLRTVSRLSLSSPPPPPYVRGFNEAEKWGRRRKKGSRREGAPVEPKRKRERAFYSREDKEEKPWLGGKRLSPFLLHLS